MGAAMIIVKILMMSFLFFNIDADEIEEQLYDITKEGYEQYEDIYVQGRVIKKASNGERYSEDRFAIIDSIFEKYHRPFTVLDVGSAQGYFSFRGAEKYPNSTFVMLEGSNSAYPLISKQVASICKLNNYLDNFIWLDSQIIVHDLMDLSKCEHFDVILALNILHWFPDDWKKLLEALVTMSHITVIEVPPVEDNLPALQRETRIKLHQHLSIIAKEVKAGVPRHTNDNLMTSYYILENKGPFSLKKTTVIHPDITEGDRSHTVYYDFERKHFVKKDLKDPFIEYISEWNAGINLLTYLKFNGQWPCRENIVAYLPFDGTHKDWMPNNMILRGESLILIDTNDCRNAVDGIGGIAECTENLQSRIAELILSSTPSTLMLLFIALFIL